MERRGVLEFVGGIGFGTLIGYYTGAKELLGIQSQGTSDTGAGSDTSPVRTRSQQRENTPTADADATEAVQSPADETTPSDGETPTDRGFLYTFDSGLDGWTLGKRRDADASEGTGSWSEKYGGSLRLHVNGAPETIMAWKEVGPLSEGTTITARYGPERFEYNAASLFLSAVIPGEGGVVGDRDSDLGENPEQDGTLEIEIPRDLPPETQIEFKLVIWPGDTTVWIQDVGSTPSN